MQKQLQMLVLCALGLFALPRTADACGCVRGRILPPVPAKSGTRFLVYGTIHDDGILEVNRCLGSGPSNRKAHELEILRQRAQHRPE